MNAIKFYFAIGAALVGLLSVYLFKQPKDNPIEELSELVIYDITGIRIDLSPDFSETDTKDTYVTTTFQPTAICLSWR